MTTPSRVTETVPDSIRARDPITLAHVVDGARGRASIVAVPEPGGRARLAGDRSEQHEPAEGAGTG
jgi:hypothetical protein